MGQLLRFLPAGTSKALSDAGVAGIKYLDAGSREKGGPRTHNFVVFDPADVTVVGEGREVDVVGDVDDRTLFDPDRNPDGEFSRKGTGVGRKVPEAPTQREPAAQEMPGGGQRAQGGNASAPSPHEGNAASYFTGHQAKAPGPSRTWREWVKGHPDK